jgi:hypothetical protein
MARATAAGAQVPSPGPVHAVAGNLDFRLVWARTMADAPHPIALSSPNVADLKGVPSVVVGDGEGHLFALALSNGQPVPGWPATTGGIPIDSTPSVAALVPGSPDDSVFVGVGGAATPRQGGYEAFNPDGARRWYVPVRNPASDRTAGATSAVIASLAVGDLQGGSPDVVAPSVGQEEYALNAATGATLAGFPWFTADSGFSTPALASLYGDGRTYIVEGGDQTAGLADGVLYTRGGHVRVLAPTGTQGTQSKTTGGLQCTYNPGQGIESSPAVGQFLLDGAVGIAVGAGTFPPGGAEADKVWALGTHCNLAWQATLDGVTQSSPALADLMGNGTLSVVEGTNRAKLGGSVFALAGATGSVLWRQSVGAQVIGSVVTADFGQGYQDVVVPTTNGARVLDGKTGQVIAELGPCLGLQNSPLVTDDPNGTIGVTLAGYDGHNDGKVEHYELVGSSGASVDETGAWPMFHHDPQLTGNAGVPSAGSPPTGPGDRAPSAAGEGCQAPSWPNGYYEVSIAGTVYRFGGVAMCGPGPTLALAQPIVGMATVPDGGGYWLVNKAGKVYAFGDAALYQPSADDPGGHAPGGIVAITATPDGRGYWLASQDGRVVGYGDALSYGAHPEAHLSGAVVAMAATANGKGYWLVTSSGSVLAFGDALPHGPAPAQHLSSVVGIAADAATGGYWLVDRYGVVYPFNAAAYGSIPASTGERNISGIQAEPGGGGYRLVDLGGSMICFGDATQLGSALAAHPTRPIIAISAP